MSKKFIPNGDADFAGMARSFADNVTQDPKRFAVIQEDADELGEKVEQYLKAFMACQGGGRSPAGIAAREDARREAEQIIRRLAHVIRSNPRVDSASKVSVGIRQRTARPKQLTCPQEPPRLKFVRALHENLGAVPMHELSFGALELGKSKPEGAVRLELFVNLIAPEDPIPQGPGEAMPTQPWYLRSYSRSPIKLVPPMARVPMRVLYWARWADSAGNVGPFCRTVAGWVEGGSHQLLAPDFTRTRAALVDVDTSRHEANRPQEAVYRVAVIEAHFQSMKPHGMPPQLEAAEEAEQRQLEGPVEAEAA